MYSKGIIYIFRILLLASPIGPALWSWHMVLGDHHAVSYEDQFQEIDSPHFCDHYLHAEYKGIMPVVVEHNYNSPYVLRHTDFADIANSYVYNDLLDFYVRGPPENFLKLPHSGVRP